MKISYEMIMIDRNKFHDDDQVNNETDQGTREE